MAESALVGVPHADFGEAVVAVVVAQPGAALDGEALIATLKRQIAGFKVPKQVFIETELPRNQMGKVQKNLLRERSRACRCLNSDDCLPPLRRRVSLCRQRFRALRLRLAATRHGHSG